MLIFVTIPNTMQKTASVFEAVFVVNSYILKRELLKNIDFLE